MTILLLQTSLKQTVQCFSWDVVFWGVTHQRDEVGERERQLHVDRVLVILNRTQLFVVSSFLEQVMDEPLLLIPAPTPWDARAHAQTRITEFFVGLNFQPHAAAATAARTSSPPPPFPSGCFPLKTPPRLFVYFFSHLRQLPANTRRLSSPSPCF